MRDEEWRSEQPFIVEHRAAGPPGPTTCAAVGRGGRRPARSLRSRGAWADGAARVEEGPSVPAGPGLAVAPARGEFCRSGTQFSSSTSPAVRRADRPGDAPDVQHSCGRNVRRVRGKPRARCHLRHLRGSLPGRSARMQLRPGAWTREAAEAGAVRRRTEPDDATEAPSRTIATDAPRQIRRAPSDHVAMHVNAHVDLIRPTSDVQTVTVFNDLPAHGVAAGVTVEHGDLSGRRAAEACRRSRRAGDHRALAGRGADARTELRRPARPGRSHQARPGRVKVSERGGKERLT